MYRSGSQQFSLPKISNSKEKAPNTSRYNNSTNKTPFGKTKNRSLHELPEKTCYVKKL